jgi:hypothetical protein
MPKSTRRVVAVALACRGSLSGSLITYTEILGSLKLSTKSGLDRVRPRLPSI